MFLSVTEGRHVSLTCNVEADPLPLVSWSYDDQPLERIQSRDLSVDQQIISHGVVRSILTISESSSRWNGTFLCHADNVAGRISANYTLMVQRSDKVGRILDLKLEYFIILIISVLCLFILFILCIVLICAVVARRSLVKHQKQSLRTLPMPRKIKMGTSPTRVLDYRQEPFYRTQH